MNPKKKEEKAWEEWLASEKTWKIWIALGEAWKVQDKARKAADKAMEGLERAQKETQERKAAWEIYVNKELLAQAQSEEAQAQQGNPEVRK